MLATSPALTLNNGVGLPALGFGVFQTPPVATIESVETAIESGYRLIDTAAAYLNEREAENIDIFDIALRADEVAAVDRLDTGVRGGPDPNAIDPERKPLTIPD